VQLPVLAGLQISQSNGKNNELQVSFSDRLQRAASGETGRLVNNIVSIAGTTPLSEDARHELELAVRMKLRVVFSSSRAQSMKLAQHTGVGASQLVALAEIARHPGMRISEFAHLRSIKNSTASNLLDKLEHRGWVRRERNGPDQRVVRLYVTSEGAKILDRAPVPARGIVTSALGVIPVETLAALDRGLGELIANLELVHGEGALTSVKEL
jgi:DNA-binding MarR family transcriptional regulator